MSVSPASINSTNVRNYVFLAWQRIHLAILALARTWRGARFMRTCGLGHRLILRDASVVADAVDFLSDRVQFAPPPRRGEASAYFAPAPVV